MARRTLRQEKLAVRCAAQITLCAMLVLVLQMGGCPPKDQDGNTDGAGTLTVSSTFGSGDEGWTVSGDAQGSSVLPTYMAIGGNPGGYIQATDDVTGGVWYWRAPAKFLGNFASAYGKTLTYDLKQSDTTSQFDDVDVKMVGGGKTVVLLGLPHPATTWTPYTVHLDASAGWHLDNESGAVATAADLQTVLGALTDLYIRGEFISGADTGGLDNVALHAD